jgi:medium-chain acyl-[acyl-carrier-protein] hydrolase
VRQSHGRPRGRTLIALPYAGGSCTVFRGWTAGLPTDVDIVAVQLPGRGGNLEQPAFTRIGPLVDALADEVRPLLGGDVTLFGHCMGAVLAFELARHLRDTSGWEPRRMIVSAARGPRRPLDPERISHLPDEELVGQLRRLAGTPEALLDNPMLLKLMLPTIRADFELCEQYEYCHGDALGCPISVLGGRKDRFSRRDLMAWRHETTGPVDFEWMPGGHFYLHSHETQMLTAVASRIRKDRPR